MVRPGRRLPGRQPAAVHGGEPGFQLRADPGLRAELDYCVPLGIPHSVFCGRIVRPGLDPAWLHTDLGYALAWQANKRETCSGCGTRADEWDVDPDAYISDHWTCEGCARLQQHQANNLDRDRDAVLPGQHAFLVPRELHKPRPPTGPIDDDD